MDAGMVCKEMPRYQCHKQVWALKIAEVQACENGAVIVPAEEGYAEFPVSQGYVDKHHPYAGGYYVVYDDQYDSFSPAEPFESGYTRIAQPTAETPKVFHPATQQVLKYFAYAHLPERLQAISKPFCDLAYAMAQSLPESPEVTVGLRKLLEAKDCMVRAALP